MPLDSPGARIPGTTMPTLGVNSSHTTVSVPKSRARDSQGGGGKPTVTIDKGVHQNSKESKPILGSVVLEHCCRVAVVDGCVCWSLGGRNTSCCCSSGQEGMLDVHLGQLRKQANDCLFDRLLHRLEQETNHPAFRGRHCPTLGIDTARF